jgi:hypothetical protein
MVLVARLPDLSDVHHWPLPAERAHGIDIDHRAGLLYVACDSAALVEVDAANGAARCEWPLEGAPDATFFNSASGLVHVAIEEPGLIQTINPKPAAAFHFPRRWAPERPLSFIRSTCMYSRRSIAGLWSSRRTARRTQGFPVMRDGP